MVLTHTIGLGKNDLLARLLFKFSRKAKVKVFSSNTEGHVKKQLWFVIGVVEYMN